jgi:hypothetical protein
MDKRFTIGRVFVVSLWVPCLLPTRDLVDWRSDTARFGARPLTRLLILGLQVPKQGPRQSGLVTKLRADLEGTLEGIKEKMAQQEARRLVTLEHQEQARLEQERRRAERERRRVSSPTRDPAVGKYAEIIESRVRARERSGRGSEGR